LKKNIFLRTGCPLYDLVARDRVSKDLY